MMIQFCKTLFFRTKPPDRHLPCWNPFRRQFPRGFAEFADVLRRPAGRGVLRPLCTEYVKTSTWPKTFCRDFPAKMFRSFKVKTCYKITHIWASFAKIVTLGFQQSTTKVLELTGFWGCFGSQFGSFGEHLCSSVVGEI